MFNGKDGENVDKSYEVTTKIEKIIKEYDVNIFCFQEYEFSKSEKLHTFLSSNGYIYSGDCYSEIYTDRNNIQKKLMNTIFIRTNKKKYTIIDSIVSEDLNKIDNNCIGYVNDKTNEKIKSDRCYSSSDIKYVHSTIPIKIVNTHLCGGKYADLNIHDEINEKTDELKKISLSVGKEEIDIIAGDFNGIHPLLYNAKFKPEYLKKINIDDSIYEKYITDGHSYLENELHMKCALPIKNISSISTTPYDTVVDYIYYNPRKMSLIEFNIIDTLDVTDHKGVLVKFEIFSKEKYEYIKKTTKSYSYRKIHGTLIDSMYLFKKYLPNFIEYEKSEFNQIADEQNAFNIYRKMLDNLHKSDIYKILSAIFQKIKIPKDTLFYNSNTAYNLDLKNFLKENVYDDKYINDKLFEQEQLFSNGNSVLQELFNPFIEEKRNKGGLYTTTLFDKDEERKNINLSISNKYLAQRKIETYMVILKTYEDCELFNLGSSNFISRVLFKRIIANILLGGQFEYNITNKDLNELYQNNLKPAFVGMANPCQQLLNNKDKVYALNNDIFTKLNIDVNCITGFWDGESTLHESIVNHMLMLYNNENIETQQLQMINKNIIGYIGLDSGYDTTIKETIYSREIVWFTNEYYLKPVAIYFKNYLCYDRFDIYKAIKNYLSNYFYNLDMLKQNPEPLFFKEKNLFMKNNFAMLTEKINLNTNNIISHKAIIDDKIMRDKDEFIKLLDGINLNKIVVTDDINEQKIYDQHGGESYYYKKYKKYKLKYLGQSKLKM
jgi:hypothetical protein